MSQSNLTAALCCSTNNVFPKDKSQSRKPNLTKLLEPTNEKLYFFPIFDEQSNVTMPLLSILNDTILRNRQFYKNIGFKSLPSLEMRESLEDVYRIYRYDDLPRRDLLYTFVDATNLERRSRRRLCQKPNERLANNRKRSPSEDKTSPNVIMEKLQNQLTNEDKIFSMDGRNRTVKSTILEIKSREIDHTIYRNLSYMKVVSFFKNLNASVRNLDASISDRNVSISTSQSDSREANSASVALIFNNLDELNLSMSNVQENNQSSFPVTTRSLLNVYSSKEMDRSPTREKSDNNYASLSELQAREIYSNRTNDLQVDIECLSKDSTSGSQSANLQQKVDFSSGDDSRNYSNPNSRSGDSEDVCKLESMEIIRTQNFESKKRSIQWKGEVDVIYYAGDADGGKVVRREKEPLREEVDQQARHKRFTQLALNKKFYLCRE